MNIIIPYEKYINYNLLSLKKRTCEKQYETGHSKQLFFIVYLVVESSQRWWLCRRFMVTRALYRTRVVMIEREREKVAINRPQVFRIGGYKVRTETDNFTKIGSTEKTQKPDKIAGCHASPVSVSCEQGKRCVRRIFPCRRFSINSPIFPSNLIVLDCFQQHRERAIKKSR